MLNVIIDTNIYRKEQFKSNSLKIIENLAKQNKILIHIPYIIEKEFITIQQTEIDNKTRDILNSIESMLAIDILPESVKYYLNQFIDMTNRTIMPQIKNIAYSSFDRWAKSVNSLRHNIDTSDTHQVIDAYFEGQPPFQDQKSKNDLPDAFIFYTIVEIANKFGELYFITNDNNLYNHTSGVKGVKVCKDLPGFLDIEEVKKIVSELNISDGQVKQDRIEELCKFICASDQMEFIKFFVETNITSALNGYKSYDDIIPSITHEYEFFHIFPIKHEHIKFFENPVYYGNCTFRISVEFIALMTIKYKINSDSYYNINNKRDVIVKADNYGASEVYETYKVKIYGYIYFIFDAMYLITDKFNLENINFLLMANKMFLEIGRINFITPTSLDTTIKGSFDNDTGKI